MNVWRSLQQHETIDAVVLVVWIVSDRHGRRLSQIVAIDAKKYFTAASQFNADDIRRELNKVMTVFGIVVTRWS